MVGLSHKPIRKNDVAAEFLLIKSNALGKPR